MTSKHLSSRNNFLWIIFVCALVEVTLFLHFFHACNFSGLFLLLAFGIGWILCQTPRLISELKNESDAWCTVKPFVMLETASLSIGFAAVLINVLFFFYANGLDSTPVLENTPGDAPCALIIAIACSAAAIASLVAYFKFPSKA